MQTEVTQVTCKEQHLQTGILSQQRPMCSSRVSVYIIQIKVGLRVILYLSQAQTTVDLASDQPNATSAVANSRGRSSPEAIFPAVGKAEAPAADLAAKNPSLIAAAMKTAQASSTHAFHIILSPDLHPPCLCTSMLASINAYKHY